MRTLKTRVPYKEFWGEREKAKLEFKRENTKRDFRCEVSTTGFHIYEITKNNKGETVGVCTRCLTHVRIPVDNV